MSIEEGFKAVYNAICSDSIPINQYVCSRCKKELRFSPVNGNCQPNYRFKFGFAEESPNGIRILYNGTWAKFEWEADLCDHCVMALSDWLLGDDWRYKESGQAKE